MLASRGVPGSAAAGTLVQIFGKEITNTVDQVITNPVHAADVLAFPRSCPIQLARGEKMVTSCPDLFELSIGY